MKKFMALVLAAMMTLALGSITVFASTPEHDDPNCVLDNVSLTVDGKTYTSTGEETIRLASNVAKFYFNATANIVHERSCKEQSSGSSVVFVYYSINKKDFVKAGSASNPNGRGDVSFSDIKIPKSGSLESGDKVTIEFRYDNESGGSEYDGDTVVTFTVYIGDHSGQPLLSDPGPSAATSSAAGSGSGVTTGSGSGTTTAPTGSDANPNTGLALTPAALVLLPAVLLLRRRRK